MLNLSFSRFKTASGNSLPRGFFVFYATIKMKARQKYKNNKGDIYTLKSFDSTGVVLESIKSKKIFKYLLSDFNEALSSKKITLLSSKSKAKKYLNTEFIDNYIKKREEIINAENNNKATFSK